MDKYVHISISSSVSSSDAIPSFILPQLSSGLLPHAWEQLSPYFPQPHLRPLQPVEQLQWIIFRSASGTGLLSNIAVILAVPSLFGGLHTISHAQPLHYLEIAPQRVKFRGGGYSNKEDSLSNQANKQALIHLISERRRERGCHVIQAEEDADVDIVKAAVSMTSFKTTTLICEDMDLLVMLLHYTPNNNAKKIYFRSDKGKSTVVYDTKVIKQVLGDEICHSLLFLHAFTGCDTISSIFGLGKKSALYKVQRGFHLKKLC